MVKDVSVHAFIFTFFSRILTMHGLTRACMGELYIKMARDEALPEYF